MKHYMKKVPSKSSSIAVKRKFEDWNKTTEQVDTNPYMDKLSLDNFRGYFHSTKQKHDDIKSRSLRSKQCHYKLLGKERQLIDDIQNWKEKKQNDRELRSLNNRVFGDICSQYPHLRHKPKTKDLQVNFFCWLIENWRRYNLMSIQRATARNGKVICWQRVFTFARKTKQDRFI